MYKRVNLPLWVQGWLNAKGAHHVFITMRSEEGIFLVDANETGKKAYHKWTGTHIPVEERVPEHKEGDLKAWSALENKDINTLSQLVGFEENIDGVLFETIKTPIDDKTIVIITKPK